MNRFRRIITKNIRTGTPYWEFEFIKSYYLKAEFEWFTKVTRTPQDNFDRQKIRLSVKKIYDKYSENRLTFETDESDYKQGNILDLDGYYLDDTTLKTASRNIGFLNDHNWGSSRTFRLRSNLFYQEQRDNGPGYDNYNLIYIREGLRLRFSSWIFNTGISCSSYEYPDRKVTKTDQRSEAFFLRYTNFDFGLQKDFGRDISLNLDIYLTEADSNDQVEVYQASSTLISLVWYI